MYVAPESKILVMANVVSTSPETKPSADVLPEEEL